MGSCSPGQAGELDDLRCVLPASCGRRPPVRQSPVRMSGRCRPPVEDSPVGGAAHGVPNRRVDAVLGRVGSPPLRNPSDRGPDDACVGRYGAQGCRDVTVHEIVQAGYIHVYYLVASSCRAHDPLQLLNAANDARVHRYPSVPQAHGSVMQDLVADRDDTVVTRRCGSIPSCRGGERRSLDDPDGPGRWSGGGCRGPPRKCQAHAEAQARSQTDRPRVPHVAA